MAEHIVAVFETEADATAAIRSLEDLGTPSSAIRQYAGSDLSEIRSVPAGETTTTQSSGGGFFAWLFGEESTSETNRSYAGDVDIYDHHTSAGNVVVSATVDDTMIQQAIAALDAHHPLDIDERSAGADVVDEPHLHGSSGLPMTGPSTTGKDFSSGEVAQPGFTDTTTPAPTGRVGIEGAPMSPATPAVDPVPSHTLPAGLPATGAAREEVIPLSEEELQVGKRSVDLGTTRIRRYVVEKPVEENVSLQSERVTIEKRRPVETSATPGSGVFEERVVEVRETAEEPVVSKTAHVVEEVVVGRETNERTETIRDTVRREEVDISGARAAKP